MTFKIKIYHIVKFGTVFQNGRYEGVHPSPCVIDLMNDPNQAVESSLDKTIMIAIHLKMVPINRVLSYYFD